MSTDSTTDSSNEAENIVEEEEVELNEYADQVDNVLRILQESMGKLKISLIMPKILENVLTVSPILTGTKYEKCLETMQTFLREDKYKDKPAELNNTMVKMIDTFLENYEVIDLLPNWLDEINVNDKTLLEAFNLLQDITEQRLRKSAMSELNKEKRIHEIYHENETLKKNIEEFERRLHNQKTNLRWKQAAKDAIIRKYEEDLAQKKRENNIRIKQEMIKSAQHIRSVQMTSAQKQKELEEELEKAKVAYKKMLNQNLQQEKEARAEKNKLLIQLQALIKKYDQNIGEKIKENIYLEEEYHEQRRQFEEFLVEYQREEAEYDEIVTQKEAEERRRHEEKLMLFMMNRSARIIQRYWRRYRRAQNKNAKKGGKGGKGGKGKGKRK